MRMSGWEEYTVRLSLAGKYRIGLNIVRAGKVGVKGLFLEYANIRPNIRQRPLLSRYPW